MWRVSWDALTYIDVIHAVHGECDQWPRPKGFYGATRGRWRSSPPAASRRWPPAHTYLAASTAQVVWTTTS
jgi:hypothetical protein